MMSGVALLSIICGRVNESQNVPVCVWKKKTCTKQNVKYVRCMCLKLKGTN